MKTLFNTFKKMRKPRIVKACIGITRKNFDILLEVFIAAHLSIQEERLANGDIKRMPQGGPKSHIDSYEEKLFFILYYLKTYCTFDVLGAQFNFGGGNAHGHVTRLFPVLERALSNLGLLPKDSIKTVEELLQLIGNGGIALIDGVEIPCVRPKDKEKQRILFSGKKKRHMHKALVISNIHKIILFVSVISPGSMHDYNLMKQLLDPNMPWFEDIKAYLDLGFYGANKDYGKNAQIHLPHKKPRKSKNNPSPNLTDSQKKENKAHAAIRVAVEHAIGGMKHFYCLTHRIRNHLTPIINHFLRLSAGLWNMKITA